MASEPPGELRLHLGAHKTATTHLQRVLHKHRAALRAAGIDFVRPVELRPALAAARPALPLPWGEGALLMRVLDGLRTGAPVLVLSEENLVGSIPALFEPRPYPRVARRVRALAAEAGTAPVTLFLAIRSFDRLWPSAHSQWLRHNPHDPGRIDRARHIARSAPPSWAEVVGRQHRAVPGATVRVWRYEDHAEHWRAIAAALVGADTGPIRDVPRPKGTVSPSAEAVRLAEAYAGPDRGTEVPAIYAAHPAEGGTPYAPFAADEVAALQARYAADLAALRADGLLLAFD